MVCLSRSNQVAMSKFDKDSFLDYNKMADNLKIVRDR